MDPQVAGLGQQLQPPLAGQAPVGPGMREYNFILFFCFYSFFYLILLLVFTIFTLPVTWAVVVVD